MLVLSKANCLCRVGDSAYVTMNVDEDGEECDLEACEMCQRTRKMRGRREVPLLECDQCLRGYHLDCLDPALEEVPKVCLHYVSPITLAPLVLEAGAATFVWTLHWKCCTQRVSSPSSCLPRFSLPQAF